MSRDDLLAEQLYPTLDDPPVVLRDWTYLQQLRHQSDLLEAQRKERS